MLRRFARDQSIEAIHDPFREIVMANSRRAMLDMLTAKHPITVEYLSQRFECAQCGYLVRMIESIGQRQCMKHAGSYLGIAGYWKCCGHRGEKAGGCAPADHSLEKRDTHDAWVVPAWVALECTPMWHTVVPADRANLVTRVPLRHAKDHKSEAEEAAYATWECKDDNIRLVYTSDVHRIQLVLSPSSLDGAPVSTPPITTLSDVLQANGPIVRQLR